MTHMKMGHDPSVDHSPSKDQGDDNRETLVKQASRGFWGLQKDCFFQQTSLHLHYLLPWFFILLFGKFPESLLALFSASSNSPPEIYRSSGHRDSPAAQLPIIINLPDQGETAARQPSPRKSSRDGDPRPPKPRRASTLQSEATGGTFCTCSKAL